jgi:glycosyltransferase involved in cell wall biosynthesis
VEATPTRCLTAVIPCFNEEATIGKVVAAVLAEPHVAEVIVVDDGSTDASAETLREINDERLRVITQPHNRGKGAALSVAFRSATSPYVVVQDADEEYDPSDYARLLAPLIADRADVVYGSRFLPAGPHRVLYYWHSVGNRLLTIASNMVTNLNLTDMETGYKAFRLEVVQGLQLNEPRFGVEPEITAKVSLAGWRIYEVGISYFGRTYAEGKKVRWRDGVSAFRCVLQYGLWPRLRRRRARPTSPPPNSGSGYSP